MRVLVCMPTYDEAENLEPAVRRVRASAPDVDLLVVDDESPDGTGRIADALAEGDPHVHVLHRPGRGGLGRAYLAGFAWASRNGYDAVVEMDADGSHRAQDLPALLDGIGRGADVVLGTRWMAGGSVQDWSWHRRMLSRGGNAYARALLRLPYRDVTGGFRAYRVDRLPRLGLGSVRSEGYCFQIDLVRRAHAAGLRVEEVPITFVEREHGRSKMSAGIVLEALRNVTAWAVHVDVGRPDARARGRAHAHVLP